MTGSIIPNYWAGWAGDLATGMRDTTRRMLDLAEYRDLSTQQVADLTIGAEVDPYSSSCNYSDMCCDIDACLIARQISFADSSIHGLSTALREYYSGTFDERFARFPSIFGFGSNWDELVGHIKILMTAKVPSEEPGSVSIITLKGLSSGRYPTDDVIHACCTSLVNFCKSLI